MDGVGCRGQAHEARQRAGDGDDAEDGVAGSFALAVQQEGDAKGLVEHTREGMGGVDGDGREQGIDFALVEGVGGFAGLFVHLVPAEYADAGAVEHGEESAGSSSGTAL